MDISVEDQPTTLVAVLRERVAMDALPAFYDRAYRLVAQEVAAAGLALTGPAFGWYRDMPTDSVDLAAGFEVDGGAAIGALRDGVEVVEVPGGPAAVGVHVGTYDTLPARGAPRVVVAGRRPDARGLPRGVPERPVGGRRRGPQPDPPGAADRALTVGDPALIAEAPTARKALAGPGS